MLPRLRRQASSSHCNDVHFEIHAKLENSAESDSMLQSPSQGMAAPTGGGWAQLRQQTRALEGQVQLSSFDLAQVRTDHLHRQKHTFINIPSSPPLPISPQSLQMTKSKQKPPSKNYLTRYTTQPIQQPFAYAISNSLPSYFSARSLHNAINPPYRLRIPSRNVCPKSQQFNPPPRNPPRPSPRTCASLLASHRKPLPRKPPL